MTTYVYIPGLGGRLDAVRRWLLRRWQARDARAVFVPMNWSDTTETYEQKYERVMAAIARVGDDEIVLVGESAGGAMAMLAYMRLGARISRVVTVCGYNHTAEDIYDWRRRQNPAFYSLVREVDAGYKDLDVSVRRRITTLRARRDLIVAAKYSAIEHAIQIQLPTLGHFVSIGYVLVKGVKLFTEKRNSE